MSEEKVGKIKNLNPSVNTIFSVLDIIGILTGLVLIDLYFWLWVTAFYNGDLVAEDFITINLWIMIIYFLIGISFFLISLRWERKRIDYCVIGVLCWLFFGLVYIYFETYLKALTLPFMVG